MKENEQYYCPSCGTLQDSFAVHCTRCGAPLCHSEEERAQRISQLLGSQQEEPSSPPAPADAAAPGGEAGSNRSDTAPEDCAPVTADIPAAGAVSHSRPRWYHRLLRPRVMIPVLAGAVILTLLFTVGVPLIRSATLGYHASPEALFDGLNTALEEGDKDLMRDLFSEKVPANSISSNAMKKNRNISYQIKDVLRGSHSQVALVFITVENRNASSSSQSGDDSPRTSYGTASGVAPIFVIQEDDGWRFQDISVLYYGESYIDG